MLKFTGKVMFTEDEERELPVKDKNGVPTNMMKKHRFTRIALQCKDDDKKIDRQLNFLSIDLPSTFVLPKQGESWTSPEVRKYEVNGFNIDVSF